MALKPFMQLYAADITKYISKKPVFKYNKNTGKTERTGQELDYINWADCLFLLYENGAEKVRYGNCVTDSGHSLFLSCGQSLPEVRVWVEIDGDRQEMTYPLIEGTKDIQMDKLSQSDIHNATQRAFVKCVAVNWGLGLSLWQKEEREQPPSPQKDDLSIHSIYAIKTRVEQLITAKMQNGMSKGDMCAGLGINERQFEKFMSYYDTLGRFEAKLAQL